MSLDKLLKSTMLIVIYSVGGILALATIFTILNIFFIQPIKLDRPLANYPAEAYVLATKSIDQDSVKEGEIVTFTPPNNSDFLRIGIISTVENDVVIIDRERVNIAHLQGKMLFCYYNCSH